MRADSMPVKVWRIGIVSTERPQSIPENQRLFMGYLPRKNPESLVDKRLGWPRVSSVRCLHYAQVFSNLT